MKKVKITKERYDEVTGEAMSAFAHTDFKWDDIIINERTNIDSNVKTMVDDILETFTNNGIYIRYIVLPAALYLFEHQEEISYNPIAMISDEFQSLEELHEYVKHLKRVVKNIILYKILIKDNSFILRYNVPVVDIIPSDGLDYLDLEIIEETKHV